MKRQLMVWLGSLLWLLGICVPVYAHEVPDLTRTGSIEVTMRYEGKEVGGGSLTLYRVGDIIEEDGNYLFRLTPECQDSKISLENVDSADTAKQMAAYLEQQKVSGTTLEIGADGNVKFTQLQSGLYLMVQKKEAEGYHKANSFLISMPLQEDGTYIYEVDASPKVELKKADTPGKPNKPTTPRVPGGKKPSKSSKSGSGSLPKTGQLWWPVAVLAAAGLAFVMIGFWKKRAGQESNER